MMSKKKDKKKALIVANGAIRKPDLLSKILRKDYGIDENCTVVAADGGARHCLSLRFLPDIIIGDMDSINIKILEKFKNDTKEIRLISSKPQKDESDTQMALDHLVQKGFDPIIIAGALGDRMDHSFANLVLLSSGDYDGVDIRMVTEESEISVIKNTTKISGEIGKTVSLFSLSPYTFFISTTGLKYRLKNEKLLFCPARGLSNEFTRVNATIKISEGQLLVVRER